MKKPLLLFILIILYGLNLAQAQSDFRYYVKGKFPAINPDFSTLFVSIRPGAEQTFYDQVRKSDEFRNLVFDYLRTCSWFFVPKQFWKSH